MDFETENTVTEQQDDVREDVVDPSEEGGSAEDLGEGEGAGEEEASAAGAEAEQSPSGDAGRDRPKQDRDTNALMAATRRRAETETRAQLQAQQDRAIAEMRIPNPYRPGQFFSSMKDLQDYSAALRQADAQKRAQAQNRSVEEIMAEDEERAFLRAAMGEKARRDNKQRQQLAQQAFVMRDLQDFQRRFPNVDVAALEKNAAFMRFAGSRYGREPLGNLYEDFRAIAGEAAAAAGAKQASKRSRATGSGGNGGAVGLTAAQREALRAWNRDNPDMRMTEKEFLEV